MAALALLALALKLVMALKTRGTNDLVYWQWFLDTMKQSGGIEVYRQIDFFNHPPFMLHALAAIDRLAVATGLPFAFWLRLPAIVADAGTVVVMAGLLRAPRVRWLIGSPRLALALLAVAPVSIMVSGFHGNTDPVMVFFTLLTVYLLEVRRWPLLAGAAFGMALNVKVVPLIFVPVLLMALPGLGAAVLFFGATLAVVLAGWMPYLAEDPALVAQHVLGYGSYYGYWGFPRLLNSIAPASALNLAYQAYGRLLALGSGAVAALAMNRLPRRVPLFLQCGVVALLFLTFTPGFGIQYLTWVAPWVLGAGPIGAAAYYATSGLFAAQVYTYWAGGFPWNFADAREHIPEWWPPPVVVAELACWATVIVLLAVAIRRVIRGRMAAG